MFFFNLKNLGIVPTKENIDSYAALIQAIKKNDAPTEVDKILAFHSQASGNNNSILLMMAIEHGELEAVRALLNPVHGIDVNQTFGDTRDTMLMLAISCGKVQVAEELLKVSEIDVNQKNTDGYTALISATVNGYINVVKTLLKFSSLEDIFHKHKNGYTALMFSEKNGSAAISSLIREKAKEIAIEAHARVAEALNHSSTTNGPLNIVDDYLGFSDYFPSSKKSSRAPEEQPEENNKRLKL